METYTLPYRKYIANGNLQYDSGNSNMTDFDKGKKVIQQRKNLSKINSGKMLLLRFTIFKNILFLGYTIISVKNNS